MDPDHLAAGEQLGEAAQGHPVGRIVEGGDEHQVVRHVEVQIAGRQPLAAEPQRPGHRQRRHREGAAGHPRRPQAAEIVGEGRVVRVGGIRLDGGGHGGRTDEARGVVDVAVGVVAGDAASQPDHRVDPEPGLERPLDRPAVHSRVPRLHGRIEQALLGRQRGPRAVHVDAPAFEDHRPPPARGARDDAPHPPGGGDAARQPVVPGPVAVPGPAVEAPVDEDHAGGRVGGGRAAHERAARVAHPAPVRGEPVSAHARRVDPGPAQPSERPTLGAGVGEDDLDRLDGGEPADDLDVTPPDRLHPARPVGTVVGPRDPRRPVALPLGGHDVPLPRRRGRRLRGRSGRGGQVHAVPR